MELEVIQNKIHEIRGCRIMLDFELADLYQVKTKVLKQAVRRNIQRFPKDFMFELTKDEYFSLKSQIRINEDDFTDNQNNVNLRSQIVTSSYENSNNQEEKQSQRGNSKWGGSRYQPFAFTEQGVAMLSSILKSEIAIEINISIMRAFVLMREMASGYTELNRRLEDFMQETNMQFNDIYLALTELAQTKALESHCSPIGYKIDRD